MWDVLNESSLAISFVCSSVRLEAQPTLHGKRKGSNNVLETGKKKKTGAPNSEIEGWKKRWGGEEGMMRREKGSCKFAETGLAVLVRGSQVIDGSRHSFVTIRT